jgi:hypothetical protein
MERVKGKEHTLLDRYFRQSRCDETDGWQMVAQVIGCPANPKHMMRSREAFDRMEAEAVGALWKVHVDRSQRT